MCFSTWLWHGALSLRASDPALFDGVLAAEPIGLAFMDTISPDNAGCFCHSSSRPVLGNLQPLRPACHKTNVSTSFIVNPQNRRLKPPTTGWGKTQVGLWQQQGLSRQNTCRLRAGSIIAIPLLMLCALFAPSCMMLNESFITPGYTYSWWHLFLRLVHHLSFTP